MNVILLTVLAAAPACPPAPAAGEMKATIKVNGRDVEVQVKKADGCPASGVLVRLLYGRQHAVAVAHTDADGRWAHTVSRTGAYDAVVEVGENAEDYIHLNFTALDSPPSTRLAWLMATPALACLFGAVLLFVDRLRNAERRGLRLVRFPAAILAVGLVLLGATVWIQFHRWIDPAADGPNVAQEAREYLKAHAVKPLSGPLQRLIAEPAGERVKTQPHPLLGQTAPDFELSDHRQKSWRLTERLKRGPVVLTFYFGYHCNHCVGQLFALNDDDAKFHELGAQVVAISADPPELTQLRYRQYGEFAFPVLTDPGNAVAQKYGVYRPASGTSRDDLLHATFVIGRDGRVRWAYTGNDPFTGNLTLLTELAEAEGWLPCKK